MSNEIDDGGPAFPSSYVSREWSEDRGNYVALRIPTGGMSLRDYAILQALQGLLASWCIDPHNKDTRSESQIVDQAFRLADMVIARKNKP